MTWLINQLILAFFNFVNSRIDAYRIMDNKTIAHGINFGAYSVFTVILCWLGRLDIGEIILLCVSAFCNRQFSFDIPLNLRRHLSWDYVTKANPPKALLDKIEIRIWGYNGRTPFVFYGIIFIISTIIYYFIWK